MASTRSEAIVGAVAELKRYRDDTDGTASYLTKVEASALLSLLIEADAFISHMRYRRAWPGDSQEVDALIGKLRQAS